MTTDPGPPDEARNGPGQPAAGPPGGERPPPPPTGPPRVGPWPQPPQAPASYGPQPPRAGPRGPVPAAPYPPGYPPPPTYRPAPGTYPPVYPGGPQQQYSPYSGPPSRDRVDQTAVLRPQPGAPWQQAWSPREDPRRGNAAITGCLLVAALLSVVYALWAFTARRGIFADFSAGRAVTPGRARTSDRVDTVLIVVAGIAAAVAVVWWVTDRARRRRGTRGEVGAFVVTALGAVTIGVGLLLAAAVTHAGTQAAQGGRGVTMAIVLAFGFVVLGGGLLLGAASVRRTTQANGRPPLAQGYPQPQRPW